MAYRRRSYKSRSYRRKGTKFAYPRAKKLVDGNKEPQWMRALRYGGNVASAVPSLARTVAQVVSMINSEEKYIETASSGGIDLTTGFVQYITGVAEGDDDTNRNGKKLLFKDLITRMNIQKDTLSGDVLVRAMLVCDKECDGAAPTIGQVLQTANPLAPINRDFSKRFTILKTMQIVLTANRPLVSLKVYKKLEFHGHYDGTTAGIADAKENQLFWVFDSNVTTNLPVVSANTRVKFYDN